MGSVVVVGMREMEEERGRAHRCCCGVRAHCQSLPEVAVIVIRTRERERGRREEMARVCCHCRHVDVVVASSGRVASRHRHQDEGDGGRRRGHVNVTVASSGRVAGRRLRWSSLSSSG